MSARERESFLQAMLDVQTRAEVALHNGDVSSRLSTWSRQDPVTLFGAGVPFRSGWADIRPVFEWLAASFESCDDYTFELLAADADGDLAYTVGLETYSARTASGATVNHRLRSTHVYRREADGWRIVHRHGDHVMEDVTATSAKTWQAS